MNTSQGTLSLSTPVGEEAIPDGTLAYFRARNRGRIHEMVLEEFLRSGISQATLARRMGKRPEQINRLLGAPGNWTLDTASDLLFAISGAEPVYSVHYPLNVAARNYRQPEWLERDAVPQITNEAEIFRLRLGGFKSGTATVSGTTFVRA